jgi:hypothetical protein
MTTSIYLNGTDTQFANAKHFNFEPHKHSTIEFAKAYFNFVEVKSFYNEDGNTFGHTGIANHAQPNPLRVSPKTGEQILFVCQLMNGVKMEKLDV